MSKAVLNFIADRLAELDIDYQFGRWTTHPVPDPYFVGEYTEPESDTKEENGFQETTFILTGTGTSWLALENAKETIENKIWKVTMLDNGSGVAVFYAGSLMIPTDDAEFQRIQINLTIKEWRVK